MAYVLHRGKRLVELSLKKQNQQQTPDVVSDNLESLPSTANVTTAPIASANAENTENSDVTVETFDIDHEVIIDDTASEPVVEPKTKLKRQRSRAEEAEYLRAKYPVLPACAAKCRQECSTNISDADRQAVNHSYWGLTFNERRLWFDSHILITPVKQRTSGNVDFKRSHTLGYSLPIGNTKKSVCKAMFLATLGLKTDGRVTEFVRAKTKELNTINEVITDGRGKAANPSKLDDDLIREHILSYRPQISHYKLENAPNRRYLDAHLTMRDMWKHYNLTHTPKICESSYQRVFQPMNIGFGKPSQDKCDTCSTLKMHVDGETHNSEGCDDCRKYTQHRDRAKRAREQYHKDQENIPDDTAVYTADMQKIILLPKMEIKEHFFISRLVVFNETFASVRGDCDYCILWHEAIAGRKAADVASSYIKCINLCAKEHVIIWADNCTGQNKNWLLYCALCWCVNQPWGPTSVTIKYLERGHTYMRADSVHGSIGKRWKMRTTEVRNFEELVDLCDKSAAVIKPVEMHYTDFYAFKDEHRSRQSKKVTLPKLQNISVAKFTKSSRLLAYQEEFGGEFSEVDFLKPKWPLVVDIPVADNPRGITKSKRDKLVKLADSFPPAKRKFWMDLPVNDSSSDLVTEHE